MSKRRKRDDGTRSGWSRSRRPVSMQTLRQQWQAILRRGFQPPFQPGYSSATA